MSVRKSHKRKAKAVASYSEPLSDVAESDDEASRRPKKAKRANGRRTTRKTDENYDDDENKQDLTPIASSSKVAPKEVNTEEMIFQEHKNASLLGMATEILCLILSQVTPVDLLRLIWTCKQLRSILTSKTSEFIWKQARTCLSVPGLPECPEDLNEIEYANLIFGRHCYFCGTESVREEHKQIDTSFSGRLRSCLDCLLDRERFASSQKDQIGWWDGPYPRKLYFRLPKIMAQIESYKRAYTFWYLPTHKLWSEEYKATRAKVRWEKEKMRSRHIAQKHAKECEKFIVEWKKHVLNEKKALVVEHLKSLGWAEEMSKIIDPSKKLENQLEYAIQDFYKFDITKAFLGRKNDRLNCFMEGIQSERLQTERDNRVHMAVPILGMFLENLALDLPPSALVPQAGDILAYPEVQEIIHARQFNDNLSPADFEPLRELFPQFVIQSQREREAKLIAMIEKECGKDVFDPATVLNLATITFHCKVCHSSEGLMQYPRALVHRHAYVSQFYKGRFYFDPWGETGSITFRKKDMLMLSNVLTQFGYDPKVTTRAEMDADDPMFECKSCSDKSRSYVMNWAWPPRHKDHYHGNVWTAQFPVTLEKLDEERAQIARLALSEPSHRHLPLYDPEIEGFKICVRCRKTGDTESLSVHLKEMHNIDNPTDNDIAIKLDANAPTDCFLKITHDTEKEPQSLEADI